MILIYQGNALAIVKATQRKILGIEKMIIFTPGYGQDILASVRLAGGT
jgi:hypothetical protein